MAIKIEKCSCGESEFLQVLPKFNKQQVQCVNCGNTGQAMSTKELAIGFWNKVNRFETFPED
ncbi:MAG TPA: hypothetical protein VMX17_13190 [Candidatus Glassbacteria bacterium]|nr:hypothetical protein [Candidatus Glassbacteria bacterium]